MAAPWMVLVRGMKRGAKVRLCGTTTLKGTVMSSIADLYEQRAIGVVEVGPDEIGWCLVSFPGIEKPLEIPSELMVSAR